ncbi:Myelin and lymphocyte protein isoform X1 [Aix galericulata]|nr:Myelin and lymphocyte protein isoform X1 [Aix galericulata]
MGTGAEQYVVTPGTFAAVFTCRSSLPSGLAVLTTFPDVLFIPELIFGGLVWILIAASKVSGPILQGWVMFVSVFCFVMTATLLFLYMCGAHGGSSSWVTLDAICQVTAALFYLSAAVLEAYYTKVFGSLPVFSGWKSMYQENIAAVLPQQNKVCRHLLQRSGTYTPVKDKPAYLEGSGLSTCKT